MKRTLLFLSALLMAISGAWAQVTTEEFTASYSASTASTGTFLTNQSWKSSGTPSMTMTCSGSGSRAFNQDNGYIFAGTYTLSVEEGYVITGYSITGHSAWNESHSDINTITPAAGKITDGNGATVPSLEFAGSDATLQVSGVNSQSVSFTMAKTGGNGNGAFAATAITITAKKEMVDRGLYTISFVSYDGTKTWGLSSSGTTASVTANATGSTFVAHKYTNESGATRWIFVNNADGYYLAYHAATQAFNISKPINEFAVANLTTAENNVNNNADCTDKVFLVADQRKTNSTYLGCYILKEANGAFDNSAAPYYNGQFTSALYLSPVEATISDAAALAIAKFDALYAVKPYVREGRNMSVLFASSSVTSVETDINAQTTIEGAALKAETFLRSAEGKKFYAVSASDNGRYLNVESERVTATNTSLTAVAVMQAEYAGNGKYYLKGIFNNRYVGAPANPPVTVATTNEATAFYIGNVENTSDNKVYFAKTKENRTDEAINYNSDESRFPYRTVNWTYSEDPASQWLITAVSDDEYTALENSIEQTLNYSLTDANGATYTGTYEGFLMTTVPTFTGCTGYTLTNGSWDVSTKTYSATINFPFAISSNGVENKTYIQSFRGSNYAYLYWYSDGTSVKSDMYRLPKYSDHTIFEWLICPSIVDAAITFTLKNVSAKKFLYSNKTTRPENEDNTSVTLEDEGTAFTYDTYRWKLPSTEQDLFLSRHNSTTDTKFICVWTNHTGTEVTIDNADDFDALASKLTKAQVAFQKYKPYIGEGLGQYNGSTATEMVTASDNVITQYSTATASQFKEWISTLENPATKLTLNLPATGGFYKIKGYATNKYVKAGTPGSNIPNSVNEATDGTDIWYYNTDNTLINYSNGLGTIGTHTVASATQTRETATFAESTCTADGAQKYGVYEIKSNYNGSKIWYSNTNNVDRNGNNDHVNCEWTLEAVTSLPVTISKYGMRTFSAPVALTIPNGVHAYTVSISGNDVTLEEVETTIPANTPVILYNHDVEWDGDAVAGSSQTYDFAIDKTNTASALACELSPIIATKAKGTNDLTLQYDLTNKVFGFWQASGETIKGFSAYLEWKESYSNVRRFVITTPSTGIESVQETPMLDKNIYDVQGRRVGKASKGLYIINGKKVIL